MHIDLIKERKESTFSFFHWNFFFSLNSYLQFNVEWIYLGSFPKIPIWFGMKFCPVSMMLWKFKALWKFLTFLFLSCTRFIFPHQYMVSKVMLLGHLSEIDFLRILYVLRSSGLKHQRKSGECQTRLFMHTSIAQWLEFDHNFTQILEFFPIII